MAPPKNELTPRRVSDPKRMPSRPYTYLLRGILVTALLAFAASAAAQNVTTYHNDIARTGQYSNETILNPSNVRLHIRESRILPGGRPSGCAASLSFRRVNSRSDVHNVLYAATEHDSVYAFDAATGTVLWQVSLVGAGENTSDDRGCSQITPEIGITATPVIDPSRGPNGALYAIAMSEDNSGNYFQRLHALDLTTGAELFGGPTTIQAFSREPATTVPAEM